ncbi:MAG: head GIN domain-containing protein [Pedobacter sp.]|uniref:head GIN domain-containing protein n=1 Tax=Pedobacter sp. TaxID=1411316 RepID=UPI00280829B5|nr:head GIN domain-containing protein [Pedobacter sp.]MDQ8003611.1 head GIN domain-containing protein [Pedobacter sp.]
MKHFIIIILGLIAIINFSACKKDRLTGNGNIISETRDIAQFTGVNSSGATDVKITYGTTFKVVVKGSSNLIPYFKTRVTNNVLYLGYENANVKDDDIEVEITMPSITKIDVSGSGEIDIKGSFPAQQSLSVAISGSAEVEVESPMLVEQVKVEISGSGEADLEEVGAKQAEANVSGSGSVKFQVSDNLKAKISGSGKVYYKGNPTIQQDISGSGKLIKL